MAELTHRERKTLLEAANKIHTYKLMQAKGYERLARKAKDDRTKQLLAEISADEVKDSEYWSQKIHELAGKDKKSARVSSANRKVGIMMGILGIRGFLEWAIIAEGEGIEDLAIQAANISDLATSEEWARIASDERLHVERVKKEVLGMEGWEMGGGGGVRDVIFGANDGLVSILALVAGVYGAVTESHLILIAGVAGAVAGAISMGAGAYLSSKSEKEVTEKESEAKGIRKRGTPEEERERLVRFYQARGLKRQEAEAIAHRVALEMESKAAYTIGEEIGLTSEESWPPIKAAILTGLSFAVVSLIPILPFAFMEVTPAVITAVIASVACLFGVGASKAIFTRKSWVRSGAEMMAIGTLAAAATYGIGLVIPL
ncbi:MAG: VIT1/CCC1 transporter family protein [Chloroflexota bacterium]|nr:VIT1/CCC1 transporter family protein [Chloroflexota bacterium]